MTNKKDKRADELQKFSKGDLKILCEKYEQLVTGNKTALLTRILNIEFPGKVSI
jgi:hypothetical protein